MSSTGICLNSCGFNTQSNLRLVESEGEWGAVALSHEKNKPGYIWAFQSVLWLREPSIPWMKKAWGISRELGTGRWVDVPRWTVFLRARTVGFGLCRVSFLSKLALGLCGNLSYPLQRFPCVPVFPLVRTVLCSYHWCLWSTWNWFSEDNGEGELLIRCSMLLPTKRK